MRVPFLGHQIIHDLMILIISGRKYQLQSSSLCSFLQPPVTFPSFRLYIFPLKSSLTPSIYAPLLRETVSYPQKKTADKIIVTYFILNVFKQATRIYKILIWMVASVPRIQSPLAFFVYVTLICYCGPRIMNFAMFVQFISLQNIITLSCILVTRLTHNWFFCIYVWINLHLKEFLCVSTYLCFRPLNWRHQLVQKLVWFFCSVSIPSWFPRSFLKAYSKSMLKNNDDSQFLDKILKKC
jgi:hypothetical protein